MAGVEIDLHTSPCPMLGAGDATRRAMLGAGTITPARQNDA